jgi:hypothetical protein
MRGPWWVGVIVGVGIGVVGIVTGRLVLLAACALVIVVSFGRYLIVGR